MKDQGGRGGVMLHQGWGGDRSRGGGGNNRSGVTW